MIDNRNASTHDLISVYEDYFRQTVTSIALLSGASNTHRVELLTLADDSRWVVKQVSQRNWLGQQSIKDIEFSEEIASAVAQQLQVTYPACIWENGQRTVEIGDRWILFIPYCSGQRLECWSNKQAFRLGNLLADIHQLQLPKSNSKPWPLIAKSDTNHLTADLIQLINECNDNHSYASDQWVTSHRDIHPGNVLWCEFTRPHLIDWESSGVIHPFVELIGLAGNCAGINKGQFNAEKFRAALQGYQQRAKVLPQPDITLWKLCFHSWLLWLIYTLELSQEDEFQRTLLSLNLLNQKMQTMQTLYAWEMTHNQ